MNVYYIKDYIISGGVVLEKKKEQSKVIDSFSNKLCSLQKNYVQGLLHTNDDTNECSTESSPRKHCLPEIKKSKDITPLYNNKNKNTTAILAIHAIREEKQFLPIQLLPPLSPNKIKTIIQPLKLSQPVRPIDNKQLHYMLRRLLQ